MASEPASHAPLLEMPDPSFHFVISPYKLVHRALGLPFDPFHNTASVKLAETFKPDQFIADIVLDHADRAFLDLSIVLRDAIFLCGYKGQHVEPLGVWMLRRRGSL